MKKIEHQVFLKTNKLDKKLLLQPIQEKMEIYDRMYRLLDTVSDCDKDNLIEQLETLDLEILEDIDNEYADKLEYNELEELIEDKPVPVKIATKIELPKKITDESILDELVKMGRTQNIGRSTLRDLGIKTELDWETLIGKYRLSRTSVFRYRYSIKKL